jgi:hypothetical protein
MEVDRDRLKLRDDPKLLSAADGRSGVAVQ